MYQHALHTTAKLDGSATRMERLLRELVELAGQSDDSQETPVLELQFGDVLTRTMISIDRGIQCLSIVALLPVTEKLNRRSAASRLLVSSPLCEAETELLWHAEEGRYVVVCNKPVSELEGEVELLDAIMDTSEQARAWFSMVSACTGGGR